jgi:multiple sugar transport system permease protein
MIATKRWRFWGRVTPYLFILPWLIGLVVFTLGPLIFSLVMSFFDWPVVGARTFIALENYLTMFRDDPLFWKALRVTFRFMLLFVPLNLVVALGLALLLAQDVRGMAIYRACFFLPSVISGVALAIIWGWTFDGQFGLLNYGLSRLGIKGPNWLNDPAWAMVAMVIASLWGQGATMLVFLAGLKGIPRELYEAAAIDGATPVQRFWKVTLPMLTPTILFNLITAVIASFQQLTLALLMTDGGPLRSTYFYALYVYENAFKHFDMGYASANAWIMFIMIAVITWLLFRWSGRWVFYESQVR